MSKTKCNSCKGEISWKEPMIIIKNTAYCEACYKDVSE